MGNLAKTRPTGMLTRREGSRPRTDPELKINQGSMPRPTCLAAIFASSYGEDKGTKCESFTMSTKFNSMWQKVSHINDSLN